MDATFVVFQLVMASIVHGALLIRGPNQNIMEGDSVTLECLYSDNAFNISRVRFESFSELLKMWRPVWPTSWCFYDLNVEQVDDKMVLHVPHVAHFAEGFFRCVSDDHTLSAPNNASKTLSFKVHYLGEVHLSREGFSNFIGLPQELRVQRGDDVVLKCSASSSEEPDYCWYKEGDDWILPSSVITLKKVSDMDSGVYTCTVEHPTALLEKMRNISLVVLPGLRNVSCRDLCWKATR
ncbi:netrin receptor DCC isoform X4 [Phyllopteryx taeniolatus]|uniref:netrin receptor DCC isoform X4 n=1 Tax=Phyllopteryx taeniolatus TaxID=161469 RepID=UPI002AD467BF|nr:netrin receptor DCC isoform X4 [Phyllopteryx taeniolatus]